MQTSQFDKALPEVRAFLGALTESSDWSLVEPQSNLMSWRQGEGTFVLTGTEVTHYRRSLQALKAAAAVSEDVSARTVEEALRRAVFVVLDIPKRRSPDREVRVKEALRELRASLTAAPSRYRVVLRVEGLADDGLPLRVGRVEFVRFDDAQVQVFRDAVARHQVSGDEQLERLATVEEWGRSEELAGAVVGVVEVEALDWHAAESLAHTELRRTIDVVNFFTDLIPYNDARLRLPGDGERVQVLVPQLRWDGGHWASYWANHRWTGASSDLSLPRLQGVDAARRLGFARASDLLGAKREDLEDQLIASLQWAGRATVEHRRELAFLLYAIALESFVMAEGDKQELGYRLQLRVAHLLGETPEARHELFARVKQLYQVRSDVVHSGTYEVTDAELTAIRALAKGCLLRVCTTDEFTCMTSPKDLVDWFNSRLLG